MTHAEAERRGREVAERDVRDGVLDTRGNIRDTELRKAQRVHEIVRDVTSNDRTLAELEHILTRTGAPRSQFPLRSVIHDRLIALHPELDAKHRAVELRPIDVAERAYEQAVLARRRHATTRHKKGQPK